MANICVTFACNRTCGYCFAQKTLESSGTAPGSGPHMSLETFRGALDFIERSGIAQARLLGGEPTLHPDFPALLEAVAERRLGLLVFSNGLMPGRALTAIEAAPEVRVLINVADRGEPESTLERQRTVFERLGARIMPGYTIHDPGADLDFLLDLIREFGLARRVRLGLAHPSLQRVNTYLHPRGFEHVGVEIGRFASRAGREGVTLELDCGFVPCMFTDDALASLGRAAESLGTRCSPILDLLPDGRIIPCHPLSPLFSIPLGPRDRADDLRKELSRRLEPYRALGVFRECSSCPFRGSGRCGGGCLATAMRRLRTATGRFTVAEGDRCSRVVSNGLTVVGVGPAGAKEQARPGRNGSTAKWFVPYVDQPLQFWEELNESFPDQVGAVYFPLSVVVGSGRPPQPEQHLRRFLSRSPFDLEALVNPVVLPSAVDEIAPGILDQLRRLRGECRLTGVTVANVLLAERIREAIPGLLITGSVLMDISRPYQASLLNGTCDSLVPASRITRDLSALRDVRRSFRGRIKLLVNEGCLPDCPLRTQHFFEMAAGQRDPRSLCDVFLQADPWLRLTGAWVLPQHLHLYEGVFDDLKLAGRVTLRDPADYHRVLGSYIRRDKLLPHRIGGGPASVRGPLEITEKFFARTLACNRHCHDCTICRTYHDEAVRCREADSPGPPGVPDR
jgi:MoaA/NifB/PqqE/SkfB family radical SAM enzyme